MAFDIYGINPRKSHSSCLRFNIWKWNDFRILLRHEGFFLHANERKFMSNDGYLIDGHIFSEFNKSVHSIFEKNKKLSNQDGLNSYFDQIYSEVDKSLVSYHGEMGSGHGQNFGQIDIHVVSLFVKDCDGFTIN